MLILLTAYLLIAGLWPAAAAPVGLVFSGLSAVVATIPGPVLVVAAVVVWRRRATHAPVAKTA
jgi:heme/copper-type cytochrome/quinol oxidase subunit 2